MEDGGQNRKTGGRHLEGFLGGGKGEGGKGDYWLILCHFSDHSGSYSDIWPLAPEFLLVKNN